MPVSTTTKDAAAIAGKGHSYVKVFLAGLAKRNMVEKVERGRYCLNGTSAYTIASRITKNSVLDIFRSL